MNHDDFARHGADLLQRVQQQVDAPRRLRQLEHRERNTRIVAIAVAAVAVAFFALLGGLWWLSDDLQPIDQPQTTTTLRALPVEASIVLLDEFSIDPVSGECSGQGPYVELVAGAEVRFLDHSSLELVEAITLPSGTVIDRAEVERLGGPPGDAGACRFLLETGLGADDFEELALDIGLEGASSSGVRVGQRITEFLGGDQ